MNIVPGRQGTLRNNLSGELAYQSFLPASLHDVLPTLQLSARQIDLLAACSRQVGMLSGMAQFVPNADMYLTMYVRKEALLSAQIEGTQCTFDDVLDPENSAATHEDVADVVNYVQASDFAVERMKTLPLCTRLLREVHRVLLQSGRGGEKQPGEIRVSQNWIGPQGCDIKSAFYLPPNVEDMRDALFELDKFINTEEGVDPVIKAALVHYQFESIHPFLDGNGRLGRLLITLSLINDGVLDSPLFYPSYQFKLNRQEYYAHLTAVRETGAFEDWIEFFCQCMLDGAKDAVASLNQLVELHNKTMALVRERFDRSVPNALKLLDVLEGNPIVDVNYVRDRLEVSRGTAANLVKEFETCGILQRKDAERTRYRTYMYEAYLHILRQGSDPL